MESATGSFVSTICAAICRARSDLFRCVIPVFLKKIERKVSTSLSCPERFVEDHDANDIPIRINFIDIKNLTIPAPIGSHDLRSKIEVFNSVSKSRAGNI
jgi:hypothetical protein